MKVTIEPGQVWQRQEGAQCILILSVNTYLDLVWVAGLNEITDPILSVEYLLHTFKQIGGSQWSNKGTITREI